MNSIEWQEAYIEWHDRKRILDLQEKTLEAALDSLCVGETRPAEPRDICEDAVLIYLDENGNFDYATCVLEVLNPANMFKAYTATDGCRYGLEGAYVELE